MAPGRLAFLVLSSIWPSASPTLSGGEAPRVKLATQLSKRASGKTLYLIDEPTTGLSFFDVHKLMDMMQRLVDKGNSILVTEHNLDVIRHADWIVDLGPEGREIREERLW